MSCSLMWEMLSEIWMNNWDELYTLAFVMMFIFVVFVCICLSVTPKIEPFAFQKGLKEGGITRLVCGVSQGDLPLAFKWFKDGKRISKDEPWTNNIEISTLDAFSTLLRFSALSSNHTGDYICEARNSFAVAYFKSRLVVQGKRLYYFLHAKKCNFDSVTMRLLGFWNFGEYLMKREFRRFLQNNFHHAFDSNNYFWFLLSFLHKFCMVFWNARKLLDQFWIIESFEMNRLFCDLTFSFNKSPFIFFCLIQILLEFLFSSYNLCIVKNIRSFTNALLHCELTFNIFVHSTY